MPADFAHDDDSPEAWAACEFDPVDNTDMLADLTNPAYAEMCRELGISLRLAAIFVGKTKPELVETLRRLLGEGDLFEEELRRLHQAAEHLRSFAAILDTAAARLLIAAQVVATEGAAGDNTRH